MNPPIGDFSSSLRGAGRGVSGGRVSMGAKTKGVGSGCSVGERGVASGPPGGEVVAVVAVGGMRAGEAGAGFPGAGAGAGLVPGAGLAAGGGVGGEPAPGAIGVAGGGVAGCGVRGGVGAVVGAGAGVTTGVGAGVGMSEEVLNIKLKTLIRLVLGGGALQE